MKSMWMFLAIMAGLIPFSVRAGDGGPGVVTYVNFMQPGYILFSVGGGHNNPPACATGFQGRWALDGTTAAGRVQVAGLLLAYTAGKQIKVYGAGLCNIHSDTESAAWFYTNP